METKIEIACSCQKNSMVTIFADQKEYLCKSCGAQLFKAHVINGYVYILSNPSMPSLLKIGFTERDVEERVEELNSTGVPVPFEIEAIFGSPNAYEDEQAIHNILDHHRLANNREFFSIEIKEAVQCVIDYLDSEPSFLKSPELLMDKEEQETYQQKKIEQEITSLQELRDEYVNLVPQKEWDSWIDLILTKVTDQKFEKKEHKESYKHALMRSMLYKYLENED